MAEADDDFRNLMDRMRSGSDEAARELFDRYSGHISRVVRRKLAQQMRRQYDSLDFLQAVWASFFALSPTEYRFERTEELIGFLSAMAYNKVIDVVRRRTSLKSTEQRDRPIGRRSVERREERTRPQPTPSQEVIAEERWHRMLAGQPPTFRRALEMLRVGHSYRSIATATGLPPKAIQRFLKRLLEREDRP